MIDTIMGIDFGTSKIAITLIDINENKVVGNSSHITNAYLYFKDYRQKEQAIKKIEEVFVRCLERVLSSGSYNILSIGLTGQMHGILGVDASGKAVTNLVTWQDERGLRPLKNGFTLLEEMKQKASERPIASGYGIVTLYDWIKHGNFRNISKVCTISDYFCMRITGNDTPIVNHTMADSVGAFDISSESWDYSYISSLGIDKRYFPCIYSSNTVTGKVTDNVYNLDKLVNVPVAISIGDNQASYLGSVKEFYNTLLINIGTGSQISFGIPNCNDIKEIFPYIDGYDICMRPFVDGGSLIAGNALSGGSSYNVIKEFFSETGKKLFGVEIPSDLWGMMNTLASEADRESGLNVNPLFAGKRSSPETLGSISGVSLSNFTPSNLIYGTLEGMILLLKNMVPHSIVKGFGNLVGSGNGIRKNRMLRDLASLLFEKQIKIPMFKEEAAIGAALNGAVAAGMYKGYKQASEVIKYYEL